MALKLTGQLQPEGVTATDLVLTITQILRKVGVVDKFVEFYGPGVSRMSLADRATIANMAPEYGATMGFFPVDSETLELICAEPDGERRTEVQTWWSDIPKSRALFRTDYDRLTRSLRYTKSVELDLSTVEPIVWQVPSARRIECRCAMKKTWRIP